MDAYEYNYIDNDNKKSIGFMAQDVLLFNALAVDQSQEMMSINYNNLFIHNINATKNLISRIETIETYINENGGKIKQTHQETTTTEKETIHTLNNKIIEQSNLILEHTNTIKTQTEQIANILIEIAKIKKIIKK